ncbi:MAG TPA: OsmC family protein [Moheibacter sp.]|nr:OsmC family protein [Moheibacter sp.]
MSNQIKATIGASKYRTQIETTSHRFVSDEPIDLGGNDLGPNPGEFLSAALAACTTITVKMYAERKAWNLEEAIVEVDFVRDRKENVTKFTKSVELIGDLDEDQRKRLFDIAARCPIHQALINPIEIESTLI